MESMHKEITYLTIIITEPRINFVLLNHLLFHKVCTAKIAATLLNREKKSQGVK